MTRADAGLLLPGTTFSDISAQIASAGNPDLKPYTSNNIDIGGEYYTGGIGYVGVAFFRKDVDGFTANTQTTVPFTSLGINFADLNSSQQQALNLRGGPNVATVTLNRPVNLNKLLIQGVEVTWVQPLDFLVHGAGFSANASRLEQSSTTVWWPPASPLALQPAGLLRRSRRVAQRELRLERRVDRRQRPAEQRQRAAEGAARASWTSRPATSAAVRGQGLCA